MLKTYTYKIKPNKALEERVEKWFGVCRYVYNLAKEVREESYKKRVNISYQDLSKQLTEAKKEFEWLREVNSQTLQSVLERLDSSYKKFFNAFRKGHKTSKPRWAKKETWRSVQFKSIMSFYKK